jgi:YidC/Oxa1 family membrane protein insertase
MMARAGGTMDPQQQQIQKFMLYVLPIGLAISGVSFPIGVLLYWLTTNVWSMGQQHYVIKRMPPVAPGSGGGAKGGGPAGDRKGPGGNGGGPGKPGKAKKVDPEPDGTQASAASGVLVATESSAQAAASTTAPRPQQNKRTAGSRKNKKRRR